MKDFDTKKRLQRKQERMFKFFKDIFPLLSNNILVFFIVTTILGIILGYTRGDSLLPFLRILGLSAGVVCGNLIVLADHAWKDGGKKLLQATRIASLIALIFLVAALPDLITEPVLFMAMVPFVFSVLFTITILALFVKETLPATDELVVQLIGTYTLWNIASTFSLSHPLFIFGIILFLIYFFFASKKQEIGATLRGVSVFSVITYLLVIFTYQLILVAKPFLSKSDISLGALDHFLITFSLGIFASYVLLYGLHVFTVILKLNPLRLFFPELQKDSIHDTMKKFGTSFDQRQYKTTITATWIMLLLLSLGTNAILGPFLPQLTIVAFVVVLATYRPLQKIFTH